MATADSQSVQISISNNGATNNGKRKACGKRFLRRSGLFLVGCAIGAAIACVVFVLIDPVGNTEGAKLGSLLTSQTDAHTGRRPVTRQSPADANARAIASVGTTQENGGKSGFRVYQSNVFQSVPGPCENVPVKQFGRDICTSQSCVETACELATSVNVSVDPCTSFYEFACEGWLGQNIRPVYSSKWSVFSRMEKMTSDIVIGLLSEPEAPEDMPNCFTGTFSHGPGTL